MERHLGQSGASEKFEESLGDSWLSAGDKAGNLSIKELASRLLHFVVGDEMKDGDGSQFFFHL